MSLYFRTYGGWSAVLTSPLFLFALILTGINYQSWIGEEWVGKVMELVPGLLGFSLGTYAILFGLVAGKLRDGLRARKIASGTSGLDEVNATFFHFVVVQLIALLWAMLFTGQVLTDLTPLLSENAEWALGLLRALHRIGSFLGYLLLSYSIVLVLGAALAVFRLARLSNKVD